MDYSPVNLKYKILELYPEIIHYGIDIFLTYDPERSRYTVKLTMPSPESIVFLEKEDADACIAGKKTGFLGKSIEEFIAHTTGSKTG